MDLADRIAVVAAQHIPYEAISGKLYCSNSKCKPRSAEEDEAFHWPQHIGEVLNTELFEPEEDTRTPLQRLNYLDLNQARNFGFPEHPEDAEVFATEDGTRWYYDGWDGYTPEHWVKMWDDQPHPRRCAVVSPSGVGKCEKWAGHHGGNAKHRWLQGEWD